MAVNGSQLQEATRNAQRALASFNGCRRSERANEVQFVRAAADELDDLLSQRIHASVRAAVVESAREWCDLADAAAANFEAEQDSAAWHAENPEG